MKLPLPRLRSSHLLILGAAVLFVLAVAVSFRPSEPDQPFEARDAPTTKDRAVSATSKALGRKRCARKCAAVQKGYIYKAEEKLQGMRGPQFDPEVCTCV
jgi:hypothetical protein